MVSSSISLIKLIGNTLFFKRIFSITLLVLNLLKLNNFNLLFKNLNEYDVFLLPVYIVSLYVYGYSTFVLYQTSPYTLPFALTIFLISSFNFISPLTITS